LKGLCLIQDAGVRSVFSYMMLLSKAMLLQAIHYKHWNQVCHIHLSRYA